MSCHNIGHAINHVQEKILELYEEKRYDLDTTKKLLAQSMDALGFCDGNPGEATLYLDRNYCSDCFRRLPANKLYAYHYFNLGYNFFDEYREQNEVIGFAMCGTCTRKMLRQYGLSPEEIETEMPKVWTFE